MWRSWTVTSLRILIVEDDAVIAMSLGDLLIGMGHKVCATVESEADAVAAAVRHKPDLMIVDANLYEGNGISAIAKILLDGFVPHIFMTGDPYLVQALAPGAIILQKPFKLHDLVSAIERSLQLPAPPRMQTHE
ncbi:MAG: response regulator [Alphaproteobacteria bacterium]|nr:response regulator [Alphaproteobacteria bacterium]